MKRISRGIYVLPLLFGLLLSTVALAYDIDPMNLDGYISVIVDDMADTADGPIGLGVTPKAYVDEKEPLRAIVLGSSGNGLQKAFAIGVLQYEKDGNVRVMVLAGAQKSPYGKLNSIEDLDKVTPGMRESLSAWCAKNGNLAVSFKSRQDALFLVGDSILKYFKATITEDDRRPMDADGNPTLLDHPKSKNIRFEYGG